MEQLKEFLRRHDVRIIFLVGLFFRLLVFWLIPIDWNSESYHHWLISYLTLHIGFLKGRLWDLLGCDYYWGIIPHLVQAFLMWLFRTSSFDVIRIFNILMGAVNSVLVFKVASTYYSWENGVLSGLGFADFSVAAIFDSIGMQDTLALSCTRATLMVLGPLFLLYFESEPVYFLMMLRFLIPVIALGLPIVFHQISKLNTKPGGNPQIRLIQFGIVVAFLVGYPLRRRAARIADRVGEEYSVGTIVCDIPSMLYRLVSEHHVEPSALLSNHYGPQYYGIDEPMAYIEWLDREDVSLWMYYGGRGDPVWDVLDDKYLGVLVNMFGDPGHGCYLVDQVLVDSLL